MNNESPQVNSYVFVNTSRFVLILICSILLGFVIGFAGLTSFYPIVISIILAYVIYRNLLKVYEIRDQKFISTLNTLLEKCVDNQY